MKKTFENLKKAYFFDILFLTGSFLAFGLFKEYAGCIYTGIWGILNVIKIGQNSSRENNLQENRKQALPVSCFNKNIVLCISVIALFYLLTCLYGIDRGMSLIGFLKFMSIPLFLIYLIQMSEEERRTLRALIPLLGCFMTFLGILGRFIPSFYQFFYVADRLGGFFQYPNVFALFCLVGLLLLLENEQIEQKKLGGIFTEALILFAGILLSGSRTVFFLSVLSAFLVFGHFPKLREKMFLLFVFSGLMIAAIVGISGNLQNAGRFLTTSLNSSTLIGRIIYWWDGLGELIKHPFGLGYLGYYYREPVIQRAVYSVRFIHNDFLQLALDVGIIPAVGFAVVFIEQLWKKELSFVRKIALLVMLLHFFMDFDLEFTAIWYLLLLIVAEPRQTEKIVKATQINALSQIKIRTRGVVVPGVVFSCVCFYIGAAMLPYYLGNPGLSSGLLPFYTEANVEVLSSETDIDKAEKRAEKILKQNEYVPEAYDVKAILALGKEDYTGMVAAKEMSLSLQKYNMESFERYLVLLAKGINAAAEKGDSEGTQVLLQAAVNVPKLLNETEKQTIGLAYKIKDVPDFTLSDWAREFLDEADKSIHIIVGAFFM